MRLRKLLHIFLAIAMFLPSSLVQSQELVPDVSAQSAVVIDSENGQILFKQDEDVVVQAGSISKLLAVYTALSLIEADNEWDFETLVPVSDEAYYLSQNYDISNVPLRQDYEYTVNELVEAVAVNLANGATLALADFIAGSEAEFVQLMEQQLIDWGLSDYQLMNATGLPTEIDTGDTNAFSGETAAVIAYHLVNDYPHYLDYSQQPMGVFKPQTEDAIDMNNYNQMLRHKPYTYEGLSGLMPGASPEDGDSFVGYTEVNDFGIISVVLGTEEDGHYEETAKLLDYSYSAYMKELVVEEGEPTRQVGTITVVGGDAANAELVYGEAMSLVVPIIDTAPRLEYVFNPNEAVFNEQQQLEAPMEAGDVIGSMEIQGVGTTVEFLPSTKGNNVPIVLANELEEAPWYLKSWRGMNQGINDAWEATRKFFVDIFN